MVVGKGIIDEVKDGVGWGTLDNGQTFDLPIYDYSVGDEVLYMVPGDDDEDSNYDCAYTLSDGQTLTFLYCVEVDDGYEIIDIETFTKPLN